MSDSPATSRRVVWRALVLALLWAALNGADGRSWIVGAPVVALAAWMSGRLAAGGRWRLSPLGAARFAGFFLIESLRGGFDVARRAFSPRLPLRPGIVCYPLRLPAGSPRWFFCGVISLLPGTAVVRIDDQEICVHELNLTPESPTELRALEERVAAMFAAELEGGR
jgi:multicomponent Na+:H+ antiporter subunit E